MKCKRNETTKARVDFVVYLAGTLTEVVVPSGFNVDSLSGLSFKRPNGPKIFSRMGPTNPSVLSLAPKMVLTMEVMAGFKTPSSNPWSFSKTAVSRLQQNCVRRAKSRFERTLVMANNLLFQVGSCRFHNLSCNSFSQYHKGLEDNDTFPPAPDTCEFVFESRS